MDLMPTTPDTLDWWKRQHERWLAEDGVPSRIVVLGGPEEGPDVIPCPTLLADHPEVGQITHVAYRLDEIELAHLAQGGTLWLTTWGGLPIHRLDVLPKEDPTA
jgi:hypothetical protein